MIPIYFRVGENDFTTNGFGRLTDCISCKVTEERNGIYELELEYPITGKFYEQMLEGGAIGAIHDDKHDIQAFDIYRHSAPIDGVVTFNAHHISYRLNRVIVQPFTAFSASDTMAQFKTQSVTPNPFTFWTDKATNAEFSVVAPANIRSLLGNDEGSVLDVFGGGDYEFDLFTVKLYQSRGVDSGVTIRYGKNLTNINHEKDDSAVFNSAAPYWIGGDGEAVFLPEVVVYSPDAPLKLYPWTDENGNPITDGNGEQIYFNTFIVQTLPLDLSSAFSERPTADELRQAALDYMSNNQTWLPDENITVDFVQLWQSPEYANVAALQRVSLCDRVSVYYPELGVVAANSKVIKVVYDVLEERYDSMELGKVQTTLAQAIAGGLEQQIQNVPSVSMMRAAIERATDLITGGLGGYVVFNMNADGQPQEILVMDTPDIMTAVHIIRINRNGIGFSNNGYEGPYESAWTIDGSFNADFITAGTINADLIRAGTLLADLIRSGKIVSKNGRVYFDLDNNTLACDLMVSTDTTNQVQARIGTFTFTDSAGSSPTIIWSANGYLVTTVGSEDYPLVLGAGTQYSKAWLGSGKNGLMVEATCVYPDQPGNTGIGGLAISPGGYIWLHPPEPYYLPAGTAFETMNYEGITISPRFDSTGTLLNRVSLVGTVNVRGSFSVGGTKSRVVNADEYKEKLLYSYETPSPLFGDVGEGQIDETGTCYIFLDPVFAETISTDRYQVFLQKYGDGDLWVSDRKPGYFVVQGTEGLLFGWELKAKQKDFDQIRMENPNDLKGIGTTDYGEIGASFYEHLIEGRMTA